MKKTRVYGLLIAAALLFTSCATTIATTIQRPAELELHGAKTISVLPFQTSEYFDETGHINISHFFRIVFSTSSGAQEECARYVTSRLTESLLDSDIVTVVGSRKVEAALDNGDEIPCDVYLTGYISHWDNDVITRHEGRGRDRRTYFQRRVYGKLVYEIVDAKTNRVIARRSRSFSGSSGSYTHRHHVPDAFEVVESNLDSIVHKIMKEIQPYYEIKYVTLLDDKDKSDEMKVAKQLAEDGFLKEAEDKYEAYYEGTGVWQAGYNAAVLLESLQNYDEAEKLMEKVYFECGEKKAYKALNDIRNEKYYAEKLQNQLDEINEKEAN